MKGKKPLRARLEAVFRFFKVPLRFGASSYRGLTVGDPPSGGEYARLGMTERGTVLVQHFDAHVSINSATHAVHELAHALHMEEPEHVKESTGGLDGFECAVMQHISDQWNSSFKYGDWLGIQQVVQALLNAKQNIDENEGTDTIAHNLGVTSQRCEELFNIWGSLVTTQWIDEKHLPDTKRVLKLIAADIGYLDDFGRLKKPDLMPEPWYKERIRRGRDWI